MTSSPIRRDAIRTMCPRFGGWALCPRWLRLKRLARAVRRANAMRCDLDELFGTGPRRVTGWERIR